MEAPITELFVLEYLTKSKGMVHRLYQREELAIRMARRIGAGGRIEVRMYRCSPQWFDVSHRVER